MASTAISAQGSIVQIATGSGGAKTITGVAVGNPTILTSSAHGFSNGDVVTFAALTGADAALLNGLTFTVRDKTTNTFAVSVDTTGKTITAGSGTATPTTFTQINNIKTFSGFDGQASELDKTNMSSTAKEFLLGLAIRAFPARHGPGQRRAGQLALVAAQISGAAKQFKLILPSGTTPTATFTAYVKSASSSGGVDQILKRSSQLRISGAIAWS
jgi:hypothetical protein